MIDLKVLFTTIKNNVFTKRAVVLSIAVAATLFAYSMVTNRVMPMAYGAEAVGADPTDLTATVVSIITAVVGFIAQSYFKVSPEVIQAVIAFEKDISNPTSQRRLGAAILGYLIDVLKAHPDGAGGFMINLINTIVASIDDPAIQGILKKAAVDIAQQQFAPVVPSPTGPTKVTP